MTPVRLRLKYAFTLYKAMLSWRHEQIAKTASTTTQGYLPSWTDVTFRIGADPICKFLRHPFHLSALKRSVLKTMRCQNAPLLKLSVFINVFGCFRVDDRWKRMKKFAFSNESLVEALKKVASARPLLSKRAGTSFRIFVGLNCWCRYAMAYTLTSSKAKTQSFQNHRFVAWRAPGVLWVLFVSS